MMVPDRFCMPLQKRIVFWLETADERVIGA